MNVWTWLKSLFLTTKSPAEVVIDMALETEIANRKALRSIQEKRRDDALTDADIAKHRHKKQSTYHSIAQRAQANVVAYDMEIAELEKRRG